MPNAIWWKMRRVEVRRNLELRHGSVTTPQGLGVEYTDTDFPSLKARG
ncbi:MAG: hypothetical protein L0I99_02140 [Micrococcaceae bacterium]|nr:hypothetical protein [Micrococcaceae bacterium]